MANNQTAQGLATGSTGDANYFRADVQIDGAHVSIVASSLGLLSDLMTRLQRTETTPATGKDQTKPDAAKPTPVKETTAGKSESSSAGAAEKASAAKPTATAAEQPAESAQASGKKDDDVLEYPVLQKAMFTLAGIDKQAALDLNQTFGVKTMKDLPEGKRREALAAVEAKIAELKAAAEAVA